MRRATPLVALLYASCLVDREHYEVRRAELVDAQSGACVHFEETPADLGTFRIGDEIRGSMWLAVTCDTVLERIELGQGLGGGLAPDAPPEMLSVEEGDRVRIDFEGTTVGLGGTWVPVQAITTAGSARGDLLLRIAEPKLVIDHAGHDFGDIPDDTPVTVDVVVRNEGRASGVLDRYGLSDAVISASPQAPIELLPGEDVRVTVSVRIPNGEGLVGTVSFEDESSSFASFGVWANACGGGEITPYDADGDGVVGCSGDSDDTDPEVHPGGIETPDGRDEDDDGFVDEGTVARDNDGDGYCIGVDLGSGIVCTDGSTVGDCADGTSDSDNDGFEDGDMASPGNSEIPANGIDDNCDGIFNQETVSDIDDDGFLEPLDCNAGLDSQHPGRLEVADNRDSDCDGLVDEGTERYDDDGDGETESEGDCDDSDASRCSACTEVNFGRDDDCDGKIDEGGQAFDFDQDGLSPNEGDCDDTDFDQRPGRTETANGEDDDCDGEVDEGLDDVDGDGFLASQECDDNEFWANPNIFEDLCGDGIDNDCDDAIDERCDD